MEKELEDAVYSGEEDRVAKIIYREPQLLEPALRYTVRYDRPLVLNLLIPLAIEEGMGKSKSDVVEMVTTSIVEEAVSKADTTTLNSMVLNDVITLYIVLPVAARMGNLLIYKWALSKMEENHLDVSDSMWNDMALSTIGGGVGTNPILSDIVEMDRNIDIGDIAIRAVGIRSVSKLGIVMRRPRRLDIPHLLIYALDLHFNDGVSTLLKQLGEEEEVDAIVEAAVSSSNVEVISELLSRYTGDITTLTLMAIDKEDNSIYSYLLDKTPKSSYPAVSIALARQGMLEEMVDLVTKVKDYTGTIEQLITSGYEDLIDELFTLEPKTVSYIPIMYTAYKMGVYDEVRDVLFSHERYVTPLAEAFDTIIKEGRKSLNKIKVDISPLKEYVNDMGMPEISRYIAVLSRHGR